MLYVNHYCMPYDITVCCMLYDYYYSRTDLNVPELSSAMSASTVLMIMSAMKLPRLVSSLLTCFACGYYVAWGHCVACEHYVSCEHCVACGQCVARQ